MFCIFFTRYIFFVEYGVTLKYLNKPFGFSFTDKNGDTNPSSIGAYVSGYSKKLGHHKGNKPSKIWISDRNEIFFLAMKGKKIDVRPVYRPSAGAAAKEIHINMYIFWHDRIAGVSRLTYVS